jgi:anti-anti-sigma factor
MDTPSAIFVKLPENFLAKQARDLELSLKAKLNGSSVNVVLDLSGVKQMDLSGLEILVNCMNEIVRRDGGLQIGSLSPEAAIILELTRLERLIQKLPAYANEAPNIAVVSVTVPETAPAHDSVRVPVAA